MAKRDISKRGVPARDGDRDQRLAAALRENLKRRKAQAREPRIPDDPES
jgi:hypothetical protein